MIQTTTLPNGIRVITETIPAVHSVALGAWVTAGSRHEAGDHAGISHFIEHMLFKGTARRSALAIAREIDAVGGCLNAFSSPEHCCYYVKVLADAAPLALDLLADVLQHSRFDLDELEKERRVILNEIAMIEDTPDEQVHELFNDLLMGGHPLARPVGGTAASVAALSRTDLVDTWRRVYCGANLVITAAGCLEHRNIVDQVRALFSGLPAGSALASGPPPRFCHRLDVRYKPLEQVHLCLGTRGVPQTSDARYAFHLLSAILGGGMSSRLFQSIREARGLAYSVYSYALCHSDAGALVVSAATAPDDAIPALHLILDELRTLRHRPLSDEELALARNQLKGNLLLMQEGTEHRMMRLAQNEIFLHRQVPLPDVLQAIDTITARDLQSLAVQLLTDDSLCLQLLGPMPSGDFSLLDLTLGA